MTRSATPWSSPNRIVARGRKLAAVETDSRPLLGPSSIKGVHLNTGQGMLGWTLACASGHDVAAGI